MSKMVSFAEKFLWNNIRMYLLTHKSCLLDNLLKIKDADAENPMERYDDCLNELGKHVGLGSYTNTQPTHYSELPYVTVNIQALSGLGCTTRVVVGFDVVFTTDAPTDDVTKATGNSNESVAAFRANIADALDELMYDATDEPHYDTIAFFDALRDQEIANPVNPEETRLWKYNIIGQVDGEVELSEVTQLKREDRSSGLSVFSVIYTMDLNRLYGDGVDCGC